MKQIHKITTSNKNTDKRKKKNVAQPKKKNHHQQKKKGERDLKRICRSKITKKKKNVET
jgi:hypothetical protein